MNDIITIKCPKDKLTLLDMWKYNLCIQEGGFVKGVYNGMCDDYDSDGPTKYSNFKEFINGEFPQVKKNAYLKTVFGGLNFEVAQFETEEQFKEQFDIKDEEENFSLTDITDRLNRSFSNTITDTLESLNNKIGRLSDKIGGKEVRPEYKTQDTLNKEWEEKQKDPLFQLESDIKMIKASLKESDKLSEDDIQFLKKQLNAKEHEYKNLKNKINNFSLQNLMDRLNRISFSSGECVGQLSKYRNGYKLCIYEHNSTCYTKKEVLQSIKNHFEDEIKCLGNDIRIKFDISWDSLEQTILDDTFKSSFMYKI